jgi:hypothetical protein
MAGFPSALPFPIRPLFLPPHALDRVGPRVADPGRGPDPARALLVPEAPNRLAVLVLVRVDLEVPAIALGGHVQALGEYWDANIYYPHPLALAYSEHLTAQAVMILPIHAAARNPILSYNVVFLSTFVLSAIGMFLFVRELTGSSGAAFLAGVAFGFAPYRFGTLPHVQVLSSMWMPFVLFGFHRYLDSRRIAPLAGAAVAWLAQNLSCGYYLLFFSPAVALSPRDHTARPVVGRPDAV